MKWHVYEIKGVKVGVSKQPWPRRILQQGFEEKDARIIEWCNSVEEASERERYWQEKLKYSVDFVPYSKTFAALTKCRTPEAIEKQSNARRGRIASEETKRKIGEGNRGKIVPKGRMSDSYKRGKYYKELTSGFTGKRLDHIERFNLKGMTQITYTIRTGRPISYGIHKGKQWVLVTDKDS